MSDEERIDHFSREAASYRKLYESAYQSLQDSLIEARELRERVDELEQAISLYRLESRRGMHQVLERNAMFGLVVDSRICLHCKGLVRLTNPSGFCNHVYYPENCQICRRTLDDQEGK